MVLLVVRNTLNVFNKKKNETNKKQQRKKKIENKGY